MNARDIILRVRVLAEGAKAELDTLRNRTKKFSSMMSTSMKNNEARFQGWALSVMFFGMAIQRIFSGIARSSLKVFQDVSHSVEGTVTGFDRLNASAAYLGFVIGQALDPVLEFLVPIIDKIADWVSEHQGLTRVIVVGGVAVGAFLTVLGGLVLGLAGVITMVKNLASAFQILRFVLGFIKTAATSAGAALTAGLKLAGIVGGLILVSMWIYKLMDQMGGFGEFVKSVFRGILRIGALVAAGIGASFMKSIDMITEALNFLIRQFNKVAGLLGFSGINQISRPWAEGYGSNFRSIYDKLMGPLEQGILAPERGFSTNKNPFGDLQYGSQTTYNISVGEVKSNDPEAFIKAIQEAARFS